MLKLLLAAASLTLVAAQSNQPRPPSPPANSGARQDWTKIDAELKGLLNEYYTGKPVRAKVVIPATKQGLEVIDGELRAAPIADLRAAAQPGDLLLIKQLRFKSKSIEIRFDGARDDAEPAETPQALALAPVGSFGAEATEATRKGEKNPAAGASLAGTHSSVSPAKGPRPQAEPRVTLRFSREIGTRDLNLQSINRLLAPVVDISSLIPPPEPPSRSISDPTRVPRPDASMLAERAATAQGILKAPISGDIVSVQPNVSELNIESSVTGARLYLDGAFSGTAPRTVRLLMGVHTVLITAPGFESWEQKFFIPAGKAATIRAQLKPVAKP